MAVVFIWTSEACPHIDQRIRRIAGGVTGESLAGIEIRYYRRICEFIGSVYCENN